MNNETNRDAEAFERHFFNWLREKQGQNASDQAGDNFNPASDLGEISRVEYLEWDEPDPLDDEEIDFACVESQPFTLGEIPTVQDRFQTLLKERLKAEIQHNPPLFPWETEVKDYAPDYPDGAGDRWVPPLHLWTAHLQNLKWGRLPIPITETVFAQLLGSCQEVVQSSLREGTKLVRAVESSLFPGQSEALNFWANKVLVDAWRGPLELDVELEHLPSYETATPEQQMALSLLAAREIIGTLMLSCALDRPPVERQWLTAVGLLTVKAQYRSGEGPGKTSIRVQCEMPGGGSIELNGAEAEATAQRPNPGNLSVELFDPQPLKTYPLKVRFQNLDQKPLKFAICPILGS